jgi:predicted Zn-dependent protease
MRKMFIVVQTLVLAGFSSIAYADVKPHKVAQISVDIPTGWRTQAPDENTMVVVDPKEEVAFRMMILEEGDVQASLKKANEKIQKTFQDVKCPADLKPTKLNGMDAATQDCTASLGGKPVDLGLLLVRTPAKKILMVLAIIDHSKLEARKAEATAFLLSVKPLAK